MRRILTLIFVAALLLTPGYAPSAHAQPSAQVAITGTVIKTANLRAGPGTTFAIVGSAQAGQPVTILGTNAAGDWYQVGEGRWIAAFLVKVASAPSAPSAPSAASAPSGLVEATVTRVVDGDTIHVMIGGVDTPLRYIGIDSPESSDPLFGAKATEANRKLVEGQKVYLESDVSDVDRYARLLRYVYLADGRMVNEVLAEQGWAYAKAYAPDTKYQSRLVAAQGRGATAKVGMWEIAAAPAPAAAAPAAIVESPVVQPTVAPAPSQAAGACDIKGNISSKGEKIYHVRGMRNYDDTIITEGKGERWFCSEQEAVAAGWRRAKR